MSIQLHGGDVYDFAAPPLDFSANISPLGLPQEVHDALAGAADVFTRYPDPHCRALGAAIAARDGVPPEWVLCGNGAADLFFRVAFALRPRTALIPVPAFSEYERALTAAGCVCRQFALSAAEDFRVTERLLAQITLGLGLLALCNPNNPTGQPIARGLLERILRACAACGTVLLLDECFLPLLDCPADCEMTGFLAQFPGLVIVRAFTKLYAMAGLRLGYLLCADRATREAVTACGQPWSVSGAAQTAGIAALASADYVARVRTLVRTERGWLCGEFERLGLRVIGSRANFLFFHSARGDLYDALLRRGILIRSCASFPGLDAHYNRAAVKTHPENVTLVAALAEIGEEG